MLKVIVVLVWLATLIFIVDSYHNIHEISKHFGVKNKFIFSKNIKPNEWLQTMKRVFKDSEVISVIDDPDMVANQTYGGFISLLPNCPNITNLKTIGIYFSNHICYSQLSQLILNINDQREVFEHYHIKDLQVSNQLGRFINEKFIFNPDIEKNFYKRRGNYFGTELKVMVDKGTKKMEFIPGWESMAKEVQGIPDVLDVTGLMTGPMQNFLDLFGNYHSYYQSIKKMFMFR